MPIYEYECEECQERFELLQKMSDPPLTRCSRCEGKVHKILSSSGLVFKGSGFYITDYTKKGDAAKPDASPSKGEGSAPSTPSPAKEAPKKESAPKTPPPSKD